MLSKYRTTSSNSYLWKWHLSHYSNRCLVCCGCLRGEFVFSGGHLPLQRPVPSNAALHEWLPLSVRCLIATDPRRDNWVSLVPSHHRQCILTDKKEVCVGLCRVLQCLDPRTDHWDNTMSRMEASLWRWRSGEQLLQGRQSDNEGSETLRGT